MSITFGFVLIFTIIIIPGLLFQRFYYFGEFSKQFNTKDTIYKSIFYSVIPGILIQLLGILIYFSAHEISFKNDLIFSIFHEISSPPEEGLSDNTIKFINNSIHLFLIHLLNTYILSISLGYILTTLVRYFNLDKLLKILRFKNQWYYVFSGEILNFKKFKKIGLIIGEIKGEYNKYKHYPPYVDVLIDNNSNESSLYSGYLIDYDLDSNNINNLDKIYLIGAHRFREKKDSDSKKIVHGSKAKISIKGDIFILNAKNIQNMNITFIPKSLEKKNNLTKDKKTFKEYIYNILLLLKFLTIAYIYLINLNILETLIPQLTLYLSDSSFFQKTLTILIITQFLSLFSPEKIKSNNEDEGKFYFSYNWSEFIGKFLMLVIFSLIYYFFI